VLVLEWRRASKDSQDAFVHLLPSDRTLHTGDG
jgi:hypothetical protein